MVSKEKDLWEVDLSLDYDARTFVVTKMVNISGVQDTPLTPPRPPYMQVRADDEIGAFIETRRTLVRLGYASVEEPTT